MGGMGRRVLTQGVPRRESDDRALDRRVYPQRIAAHCAAHARRKFDELVGTSEVAKEAIKRIGWAAAGLLSPAMRSSTQ